QTTSQKAAEAFARTAVTKGKVTAAEIAERTLDAVAEGRFYVVSHPNALGDVRTRAEDIVALRNPTDPFGARPEMRETLRAAVRSHDTCRRVSRPQRATQWPRVQTKSRVERVKELLEHLVREAPPPPTADVEERHVEDLVAV